LERNGKQQNIRMKRGTIITRPKDVQPRPVQHLLCRVNITSAHTPKITPGHNISLMCHTAAIPCQISALIARVDKKTGKTIDDRPPYLTNGDAATIVITPLHIVQEMKTKAGLIKKNIVKPAPNWTTLSPEWAIERYADFPRLGSFAVFEAPHNLIMVGRVLEVNPPDTIFDPNVILSIPNKKVKRKQRRAEKEDK